MIRISLVVPNYNAVDCPTILSICDEKIVKKGREIIYGHGFSHSELGIGFCIIIGRCIICRILITNDIDWQEELKKWIVAAKKNKSLYFLK